jgi:hypothetical protein
MLEFVADRLAPWGSEDYKVVVNVGRAPDRRSSTCTGILGGKIRGLA